MAAPTLAPTSGRKGCVFLNGFDVSGSFTSFDWSEEKGTIDFRPFRAAAIGRVDDLPDSSASGDAIWDPQVGGLAIELDRALKDTARSNLVWVPEGDDLGNNGYAGLVIVNADSVSGASDALNAISFEAQGTETGREFITVLHKLQDETATGDEAAVDNGAGTSLGAAGFLHVMEADGTGSLDVIIEQSTTGAFAGEETTLITFAAISVTSGAITSTKHERVATSDTTTVDAFLRASFTLTTITRALFSVVINRRAVVFT